MKKVISTILALGLILTTFTACESSLQKEIIPVTKYTTEGKTNELIPDETMTGELVISDYILESKKPYYDIAVEMYNELYPNVNVTLDLTTFEEMETENYFNKIGTEIMSGKGPDIFRLDGSQDAYKMMKSGALADLTTYYENDKAFNVSKYNENVLYGGQFQGKQYLVPVTYKIDGFFTSKEIVDEIGFDIEKCTNYYNTMEEIFRVSEENVIGADQQIHPAFNLPYSVQTYGGLNTFDYINNTVDINNDTIRSNIEITKKTYDLCDNEQNSSLDFSEFITKKKSLFIHQNYTHLDSIGYWGIEIGMDDEVVFVPVRNDSGGITTEMWELYGVNANCDNIENAYNFLKILVYPDFLEKMVDAEVGISGLPLSYDAVQNSFDRSFRYINNEHTDKLESDFLEALKDITELDMHIEPKYILFDEIRPYFNDEKTLDECLVEAQRRLEIYISE